MRIAIVDDMEEDREAVKNIVVDFTKENNISTIITSFDGGEEFLENYQPNEFDIVILDIYMYEKNGMDVASYIRAQGDKSKIIFTTFSIDFAVESYDVRAIYYIIKPVKREKVFEALSLCVDKEEKSIQVLADRTQIEIPLSKIYWVESQRNTLIIHLENNEIKTYMTFQKLLSLLEDESNFLVSCKGCIVNMDYISEVRDFDFALKNDESVQIRKRNGKQVKNDYLAYICKKEDV